MFSGLTRKANFAILAPSEDRQQRWRLQDEAGNMPALQIQDRQQRWRVQDVAGNMPALQLITDRHQRWRRQDEADTGRGGLQEEAGNMPALLFPF